MSVDWFGHAWTKAAWICGVLKARCEISVLEAREAFRETLTDWFAGNGKDYPWRRTHDAYAVLVSEVMLQQTQIVTVVGRGYFTRFMETFPDVTTLAAADDASLLKAWEGLGYYRRVRMLRDTARAVCEVHGGRFPSELEALLALPGIGRYTAGALRAFAFGLPGVLVDGNVVRVLSRVMDFSGAVDGTAGMKQIWEWADELADPVRPRLYHAGLMELGQTICRPGVPDCLNCPVARFCQTDAPERLPVKGKKIAITAVDEHAVWLRDGEGRVLLHHERGKRRTGLWKLPVRAGDELRDLPVLAEHRYSITRYRVELRVHHVAESDREFELAAGDVWIDPDEVPRLAIAAPFRRVIEQLLWDS
jgi:A/G-specific adenine glycosylase